MSTQNVINAKNQEVLFVTEQDIKVVTPISANKVQTSLINYITLAQDMYIKKNLSTDLYNRLMAEWVQSSFNSNMLPDGTFIDPITTPNAVPPIILGDVTNYKELYFQIRKPLIWYSYLLALPHIAIRVEEVGVMLNSTDYSESSGLVGLDRLINEGKMISQSYMDNLQEYLCATFKGEESLSDTIDAGGASFGIFVPKRNHHKFNNTKNCKC